MNFKVIVWWQWVLYFFMLIVIYAMGDTSGNVAHKNLKYRSELAILLSLLTIVSVMFGLASIFYFKDIYYLALSILLYAFFNEFHQNLYK